MQMRKLFLTLHYQINFVDVEDTKYLYFNPEIDFSLYNVYVLLEMQVSPGLCQCRGGRRKEGRLERNKYCIAW